MKLQLRICAFFATAPETVLTQAEMARKFGITNTNVKDMLEPCVKQGVLSIETKVRGRHVYRAGPALLEEL